MKTSKNSLGFAKKGILKAYPSYNKCFKCGSYKSYTNPFVKCRECSGRFCFDHINCGMVNKTMSENDEVRDICSACVKIHAYRPMK